MTASSVTLPATAAIAIVLIVTLLARAMVRRPGLARLRALFPSWRFFDRATVSPQLLVRSAVADAPLGPWATIDVGPRPLGTWAFAPRANLVLAYHNAIEHLVQELGELELEAAPEGGGDGIETDPRVTGLVSYELVDRIARAHLPAGARAQWKIVIPEATGPCDYLVSPEIST